MPRSKDLEKYNQIPLELRLIGKRIKELRVSQGFANYEDFAFQNELPRSQFGKFENGANMTMKNFFKVIKALNISPEQFFSEGFEDLDF